MTGDQQVTAAYAVGASLWPGIDVSLEDWRQTATELGVQSAELAAWPGDFYLACAAGRGNERAIAAIDVHHVRRLARRLGRLVATPDAVADVMQAVRERLFVGPSPRIRAYNAAGPLSGWIRVIATRIAIDARRKNAAPRERLAELAVDTKAPPREIEVALTKSQYKGAFEEALRGQLALLSPRDRRVLRHYLVEGVSVDKIAAAHGVHRVTVARWIWNAGEIVLEGLRRYFRERHGFVPDECDSLARLVRSQLSLDLPRLLAE